MWYFLTIAGLTLCIIAIWPFSIERRRTVIGPNERHGAPGDFARLSQGVTHYRWAGPARGQVAVVIHGLASPMQSMDAVADGLGALGYRVLLYDLYGRGLSDAPEGRQNRAFFLRQLKDLLAFHDLREEVTLVGYSMGGEYRHRLCRREPLYDQARDPLCNYRHRRERDPLCPLLPPGAAVGDWWHALFAHGWIKRAIPQRGQTKEIDNVQRAQRRELTRRGYLPGILSSRRGMLAEVQEEEHRKLGRKGIPVIAIWAENDSIIPLTSLGKLAEWNRTARHEVVAHADHGLPYTHGRELIEALRSALRA